MKNESVETNVKMRVAQSVLMRAFVVNTLFVLLVWLLTFIPGFIFMGVLLTGVSAPVFYVYAIGALAVWGLAGVILFLVPAIAVWWARKKK
ncbi:MAG: hypothetical protein IAC69_02155 [Proteobacteria bacterium]|uniref:Uncharacterized protein n=1 Tax=Candidatus Enterousia avistercoris TaxID=2840788 RepID=A0A9D9DEY9_9PROT|nr:hypothetical protein [Candidatus Enterousia avistercoris]